MSGKIAVIGSTMMDLTVYADVLPAPGETRFGNSFTVGFGGKGANQAVMAAHAGASVSMIAGIGKDSFGDDSLKNFLSNHMSTDFVTRFDTHTGVAHIWVDGAGQNRISIVPGANFQLTPAMAVDAIQKLKDVDVLIGQCEIPQDVTLAAFKAAKGLGITTVMNPAPYQPLSDDLLKVTDWLIPNEIEYEEIGSATKVYGRLLITLGSDGALLHKTDGSTQKFPTTKVTAIDTTGAGDCFIGAFASALADGASEESAVKFALACATQSVTKKGAQSSYPSKDEIDFSLVAK
jgi:ribokinase